MTIDSIHWKDEPSAKAQCVRTAAEKMAEGRGGIGPEAYLLSLVERLDDSTLADFVDTLKGIEP